MVVQARLVEKIFELELVTGIKYGAHLGSPRVKSCPGSSSIFDESSVLSGTQLASETASQPLLLISPSSSYFLLLCNMDS